MKAADRILDVLKHGGEWTGHDIAQSTGLWPGSLYPALCRLETAGRIESRWMAGPQPRARLYRAVTTTEPTP